MPGTSPNPAAVIVTDPGYRPDAGVLPGHPAGKASMGRAPGIPGRHCVAFLTVLPKALHA
jgi:hypothetical protein